MSKGKERCSKGKGLFSLVSDYVCIDLETTGFDPTHCEIIEFAGVRVRGGEISETLSVLIQPRNLYRVDEYLTRLTGITQDMLLDKPFLDDVLPTILEFIGTDVIIGHNVSFDINFLYDAAEVKCQHYVSNNFVDTMRMARKMFPDFYNHKLTTLVKKFGIAEKTEHRALSDVEHTISCYNYMANQAEETSFNFERKTKKRKHPFISAVEDNAILELDEAHPLYNKVCVFTGALEYLTRAEAEQLVVCVGGMVGSSVTKKTNFLILVNNDFCKSIKDGKSSKQKRAEELILSNTDLDLQVVSENVFYDILDLDTACLV